MSFVFFVAGTSVGWGQPAPPVFEGQLSAWIDGVWGCKRRFKARYGDAPDHPFLGGAVCTSTVGLQLAWRFAEQWMVYAKVRQFDTINMQARRAEKRKSEYWARRDIAIGTVGMAYEF